MGDPSSIPGMVRSPGEGNGNPLQFSCLEKSHGWRSLVIAHVVQKSRTGLTFTFPHRTRSRERRKAQCLDGGLTEVIDEKERMFLQEYTFALLLT